MNIPKNAFIFCKITLTVILWLAFIFRIKELVLLSFLLLLSSAILTVKRAPLIVLYSVTIEKIFPSKKKALDKTAMRFAHSLGSILAGICVIFLYTQNRFAWPLVFIFAILKTISAAGFCPGEKIYSCMKGGCCATRKC